MHTSRLGVVLALLYVYAFLLLAPNSLASATEKKRGAYHGTIATEYPAWFKDGFLNLREDIAEAKTSHKRVMLLFTQDNCPYCNALAERNLAQKEIEQRLRQRFEVIAINVWGDREVIGLDGARHTEKSFATPLKVQFPHALVL